MSRLCEGCGGEIPSTKRSDAIWCSPVCGGRKRNKTYYDNHPEALKAKRWRDSEDAPRHMHSRVKHRAKTKGIPFTIEVSDIVIPDTCPVLGIPLERNRGQRGYHPSSPSLDRITPALGYVKGNIRVISARANLLKSNATMAELEAVLRDYQNLGAPNG